MENLFSTLHKLETQEGVVHTVPDIKAFDFWHLSHSSQGIQRLLWVGRVQCNHKRRVLGTWHILDDTVFVN
jgi:hypothetical protein